MSEEPGSASGSRAVTQEHVLSAPLTQFPGKQLTVFVGNFEPGAGVPFHRHPGTELLYVLEGEGVMHIDGATSRELKAGAGILVSPEPGTESFTHRILNTNQTRVMRNLVIVIHDEGVPPALPAEVGTQ